MYTKNYHFLYQTASLYSAYLNRITIYLQWYLLNQSKNFGTPLLMEVEGLYSNFFIE